MNGNVLQRKARTRNIASRTMAPDILDRPAVRSRKVIGTGTMRERRRWAHHVVST